MVWKTGALDWAAQNRPPPRVPKTPRALTSRRETTETGRVPRPHSSGAHSQFASHMDDNKKTKAELVRELKSLRRRVAELERTSDVRASGGRAAGAVRKASVLVVDDQAEVRSLLRRRLEA